MGPPKHLILVDNVGKANPFDFHYDLDVPLSDVTRIELVSASIQITNVYATMDIAFKFDDRLHRWPLFADLNYDSPASIDRNRNRYFVEFENPYLERLRRISVKIENVITTTQTLTQNDLTVQYFPNNRITLIFSVETNPVVNRDSRYITMGRKPELLRDYYLVDNRDAKRTVDGPFHFVANDDERVFRNVSKISLKEVVLSRQATNDSYVHVHFADKTFTVFFKYGYGVVGTFHPYYPLLVGDYNYVEMSPPMSILSSPIVRLTGPEGGPLDPNDPIAILLFEIEYTPYVDQVPTSLGREQYTFELIDNRNQTDRYDFYHDLAEPLRNISKIEIKHLTFPADPAWTPSTRPYYVVVELPELGASWNVPFDAFFQNTSQNGVAQTPNTMVMVKNVHRKTFDVPVNAARVHVRYRFPDGTAFSIADPASETPAVLLLALTYDPRT
jgi:hypothetical protein